MHEQEHEIVWHAPTHEHRAKTVDWYIAVGIVAIALVIAFSIAGNFLLSVIIILAIGILLATAHHEPRIVEYALCHDGIRSGKTLYPWDTLDSFWILKGTAETKPKLLLISQKMFMPHIVIILDEDAPISEIREVLNHMLPAIRQAEPLPERLMRVFGF